MNVASLENCKELYELSGWKDIDYCYYSNAGIVDGNIAHRRKDVFDKPANIPAYPLGYLLRKLQGQGIAIEEKEPNGHQISAYGLTGKEKWFAGVFAEIGRDIFATTPEDAACKLAIELWKQGVLS